ncbi:PPE family protein [Mycobacterium simiae]|uniref:PPE family protein n=1 Tax=Mycobacterium simiae TaxID=1784 RepID=A0A5B1BGI8_MYCSI|nr:PPE family protein [Mycobacterium simiae]KAA1246344.1 PPE family protein [Mycobacterium simiae]
MDFAAFPPEVNSGLMYTGAGAGPLLAAGSAWNGMAVELSTTAASFESVVTQLTSELWLGPASLSAAAAAQPYIAWLTYTAAAAEQAGMQAMASAAAYEAAFAATVPPPVIAANRALLAALVATNFLGINTPAIMATELQYMEMWAQDALAMYGYAAASGAAGVLTPISPPAQATNPAGVAAQAAAVGAAAASPAAQSVADLITLLPNAISGLASPVTSVMDATGLSGVIADIDAFFAIPAVSNAINGVVNTAAWYVMATVPNAIFLSNALAPTEAAVEAVEGAAGGAAGALGVGLAESVAPAAGAGVAAGMGEASLVGSLAVPASWSSAAPATVSSASLLSGSGWTVPEEGAPVSGMAGMPGMATAAKGAGSYAGPRYGFKPTVMPKQVVV